MKVRIEFTVDVDTEVWQGEYGVSASEVREDVKLWAFNAVINELADKGLLMEPSSYDPPS